jgi:DNA topoisomerase I
MTSTLQQEASRKLRLGRPAHDARRAGLYENGYITYMRTDSTTLSESAVAAAARRPASCTAPSTCRDAPRRYASKVKNAQEAHEAIRPAGDVFRTPARWRASSRGDEFALYELIWKRTSPRRWPTRAVDRHVRWAPSRRRARCRVLRLRHRHHLPRLPRRLRGVRRRRRRPTRRRRAPAARPRQGDDASPRALEPEGTLDEPARALHRGQPGQGARGAGHRPAVDVRVDHGHDRRPRLRLQARIGAGALFLAFAVVRCSRSTSPPGRLRLHRAAWRTVLDRIAGGDLDRVGVLDRFYRGDDRDFAGLQARSSTTSARSMRAGSPRSRSAAPTWSPAGGRTAPTSSAARQRANVPPDLAPDELTAEKAEELLALPSGDRELGVDPEHRAHDRGEVRPLRPVRHRGPPEEGAPKSAKPRTGSLFASWRWTR